MCHITTEIYFPYTTEFSSSFWIWLSGQIPYAVTHTRKLEEKDYGNSWYSDFIGE